ncbi:MAG: tellurium resistance protein TerC [Syntrophus sp. (in: bacteria)]|nr:tellurium resistance protein TerC [Syntrophus sp. (in: bacteria)]
MDFGALGSITFDLKFLTSFLSIIIIDLVLAGDNAVVIAMAVRSLPKEQRKRGILFGAGAAIILRVGLTIVIAQLTGLPYVKLIGGALILWIAVKLFVEGAPEEKLEREATSIMQALKIIVIADITMSLDNMLAVAGASHGNSVLIIFGLLLSIPFIVFTSNLLTMLMDKYPVIIYIGAAILGKVGGEMIFTDFIVAKYVHIPHWALYCIEGVFAGGVLVVGKILVKRKISKAEKEEHLVSHE